MRHELKHLVVAFNNVIPHQKMDPHPTFHLDFHPYSAFFILDHSIWITMELAS